MDCLGTAAQPTKCIPFSASDCLGLRWWWILTMSFLWFIEIHYSLCSTENSSTALNANRVKSLSCRSETLRATDQSGDGVYQLPIFFFRFLKLGDSISGSWIAQKLSWLKNKEPISVKMDVLCQLLMFSSTALQVVSFLSACGTYLFIYLFTQKIEKDEPGIYSSLSLMTMG